MDSYDKKIKRKENSWGVLRSTDWHLSQIWIKTWGGDSSSVTSARKLGTPGRLTHHTSWYSFSSCKWAVNSTVFKIAVCLCFLYVLRGYWFHVGFKCWLFSSDWVSALQFIRFYLCQTNTVDRKMWSPFLASLNHTVFVVFNIWISVPSKLKRLCLYLHCPQYFVANNPLRDSISASIPWKMSHDLQDEVKSWIWMWLIPQDLGTSCWH